MLDWLSITGKGPFWSINMPVGEWAAWEGVNMRPGAILVAMDGTSEWGKRYYLTDSFGGEKLATILAAPINRKRHERDAIVVQFANCTLATGEWREIGASLWAMGCTYEGVQKLDIAADGFTGEVVGAHVEEDISARNWQRETLGGGGEYIAVVQAALAGYGRYYGKARWGTEHLGNQWNGFNFGTRGANKFLRCYRKKREMKAKGHKAHIAAAWCAALGGYDAMRDPREVGRLEVSVKGRELRRYYGGEDDFVKLAQLHDATLRAGVFDSLIGTMFDFRTYPIDGRARTARPMARWDWTAACLAAPPKFKRHQREHGVSPARVKMALHFVHDIAYYRADPELMKLAEDVARASGDGMLDYFRRKTPAWQEECARGLLTQPVADGIERTGLRDGTERERFQRLMFRELGAIESNRRELNAERFLRALRVVDAVEPGADAEEDDLSEYL